MSDDDVARASVSAREAEVLAALGERLTNAEIAGQLFISIRTVESHVSSLLRKLGVGDRRALSAIAREAAAAPAAASARPPLPAPLTSFVGRTTERAQAVDAVCEHRLVSIVGPGGVGKTRLALAAAADASEHFADGAWYVDLVPVTQSGQLARAVLTALGAGEQPGRTAVTTLAGWFADRKALLVLDNCEHLADAVVELVEHLLAAAPGLVVLATSRARLMVPFEQVLPLVGLDPDGGAAELFTERAAAAGVEVRDEDRRGVERICAALDGVPLAIELAAARMPSIGIDGLEAGLADRLTVLAGAKRVDRRHTSLRSALDWSYELLDPADRAVLRRLAVFAGPFDADAAAAVVGGPSVPAHQVRAHLATLADHSLLVPLRNGSNTRYAALETIRQYAAEQLDEAGETVLVHARHLSWCTGAGRVLAAAADIESARWRESFDPLADELRAALGWPSAEERPHDEAHAAAVVLATLCYQRGMPQEAQERFEEAAGLTAGRQTALDLARAADAARARLAGDEAWRLHRGAATAAEKAGEPGTAAAELARAAELVRRSSGIIVDPPPDDAADDLLDQARALAGDDQRARARIAVADAFVHGDTDPAARAAVDHAVALAREIDDPLSESAALDRLTTILLGTGEVRSALEVATRRTELLAPLALHPDQGFERPDAFNMATEAAIAAGDLAVAGSMAERTRALPLHREIGHVGSARTILVSALTGDWAQTVALGAHFRDAWERAGRQRIPSLRCPAFAAAAVHGMRGEDAEHDGWRDLADELAGNTQLPERRHGDRFFEAWRLLHLGEPDAAVACLQEVPRPVRAWFEAIWRPWYAATLTEAAVLSGDARAAHWLDAARTATADNRVATILVERAAALAAGDRTAVARTADQLSAAGSTYHAARSLLLAGGADAERGRVGLLAIGAVVVEA